MSHYRQFGGADVPYAMKMSDTQSLSQSGTTYTVGQITQEKCKWWWWLFIILLIQQRRVLVCKYVNYRPIYTTVLAIIHWRKHFKMAVRSKNCQNITSGIFIFISWRGHLCLSRGGCAIAQWPVQVCHNSSNCFSNNPQSVADTPMTEVWPTDLVQNR